MALVFTLSEADAPYAYDWAYRLRKEGLRVEFYPEVAKLKKQFDYAEKPWDSLCHHCGRIRTWKQDSRS